MAVIFVSALVCPPHSIRGQGIAGSVKGTITTAAVSTDRPELLPGATLVLINTGVKNASFKTQSDELGNYSFRDLPAGQYRLTAEASGFPTVTRDLVLATGASLVVAITMKPTVSEAVTIRDEEGLLSTGETTTANTVRAEKMEQLPLRADNYQGALPLTPSIVRDVNGKDHIKGTRAGQDNYSVNGADVTDPVTGSLAFDIPLEAAANVHIEDNPYSAEFGKTTGGATNLETKSGGDRFKLSGARVFPTFHTIFGGKVDSFRPRITFEGPLIRRRLNFLQSFEYRFFRTYVPSLSAPRDNSTSEAFNSFTQIDSTINANNRLKLVVALFPEKKRYVGLNTFNPQSTTANTKQHGDLFTISEQSIFHDQSFLSSLLAFKTYALNVYGIGSQSLVVMPQGNRGSYFADTKRSAQRWQWQEQYFMRLLSAAGQHSIKIGTEIDITKASAAFNFRSIEIRRADETLSEQISFLGPSRTFSSLTEAGGFIQDRWSIRKNFSLDAGIRIDHDSIARHANVSPRIAVLFLPFANGKTVVRGGLGVFFDRSTISTQYFDSDSLDDQDEPTNGRQLIDFHTGFPQKIVTTYARNGGIIAGPLLFSNVIKNPLRDAKSVRWSAQVDERVTPRLTIRAGYVHRSSQNEPVIIPKITRNNTGLLILKSKGTSRYNEFQVLALYNSSRFSNWTVSYTWSKAKGSLNTADYFVTDFPDFVVRPNQYGILPFDVPHRLLAYGEIKAPWGLTVMPAFELRSGFPFSFVNERLDFVGDRNRARFPTFVSLDATIMKSFTVPHFDKKARAGVILFNMTNHFNPRDVQNNLGSSEVGKFFNSLGTSLRAKFELDF